MSETIATCEEIAVHPLRVEAVQKSMPEEAIIHALARTFKALADPSRVRILYALSVSELCVCDLARVVGLSISATSHQLALLRRLKLVKYRREGKMVYYSLDDEHIEHLLQQGLTHVGELTDAGRKR